jgi:hypothetical protein
MYVFSWYRFWRGCAGKCGPFFLPAGEAAGTVAVNPERVFVDI